jgi:hypothetical protein
VYVTEIKLISEILKNNSHIPALTTQGFEGKKEFYFINNSEYPVRFSGI